MAEAVDTDRREPIGLIGVGLLGSAIAERLINGGYDVVGYDVEAASRERLLAMGGKAVDAAVDVLRQSQCVLLSLPDSKVVHEVVGALRPQLRPGLDILDTTTGSPEETVAIASDVSGAGVRWLDSTVVGSSQQLREGAAIILVGGDSAAYDQHKPLLGSLGQKSFYVGSSGRAASMKLVVNLVIGLHRAVLAEGLTFAQALNFDLGTTLEILRSSAAYSRMMDTKGHKMITEEFSPQARLAQHLKDVELILASGAARNAKLPLSKLHRELLQRVVDLGEGDLDNSAIIKAFAVGTGT